MSENNTTPSLLTGLGLLATGALVGSLVTNWIDRSRIKGSMACPLPFGSSTAPSSSTASSSQHSSQITPPQGHPSIPEGIHPNASIGCPYLASQSGPRHRVDISSNPTEPVVITTISDADGSSDATTLSSTTTEAPSTPSNKPKRQDAPYLATPIAKTDTDKAASIPPRKGKEPLHYHKYLMLDDILNAQHPKSWVEGGTYAHDELLFIVTHQSSEIWFKQIIHDLSSIIRCMNRDYVSEFEMGRVIQRLTRISKIQQHLVQHLPILETMSPLSFLDFRDYLFPASGFQSMQFRIVETLLGLKRENRLTYAGHDYDSVLLDGQRTVMKDIEMNTPSLFELVDRWLCRTPILRTPSFDFWEEYKKAVYNMLDEQLHDMKTQYDTGSISQERYNAEAVSIEGQKRFFSNFFDEEAYIKQIQSSKGNRLSYRACQAAIMINFYQDIPLFQVPYQLLTLLIELDDNMAQWRNKHASMVHRMLGLKMGTGGSSGFAYLSETVQKHRVFQDFGNLASLMLPRAYLPALPPEVLRAAEFFPSPEPSPTRTLD